MRTNKTYVLDSYAVLGYVFGEEPSISIVRDILSQAQLKRCTVLLNEVNLGEVYYMLARKRSKASAEQFLTVLCTLPITLISVDRSFIIEAARIKSENKVSYSDAFCIYTSKVCKGTIITGDPEYLKVPKIKVLWSNHS